MLQVGVGWGGSGKEREDGRRGKGGQGRGGKRGESSWGGGGMGKRRGEGPWHCPLSSGSQMFISLNCMTMQFYPAESSILYST